MLFGDLLQTALESTRGKLDLRDVAARVDRFVTSRSGFLALEATLRGRDAERISTLRAELEAVAAAGAGIPVDDSARGQLSAMAARVVELERAVPLSDAPARRALRDRLEAVAPIVAGVDPYRPVKVSVTGMTQRQITLGAGFDATSVRTASAGDSAAPHLVLIHGHASRIEEYEDLAARLAAHFRIHLLDLPGCGYSEKPAASYSLEYYERVLGLFLTRLEREEGAHRVLLAGGGMGGNLSLRLAYRDAAARKGRIAKVAAWSVAGWGTPRALLALGSRVLSILPRFVFYLVAKAQLEQQYSAGWPQRASMIQVGMDYRREIYVREFQAAYAAIAAQQVGTSMLSHAGEIRCPVTLLAGELDTGSLNIRAQVENLALAMKVPPIIVPNSGYAIANEQPDVLASHLVSFFGR